MRETGSAFALHNRSPITDPCNSRPPHRRRNSLQMARLVKDLTHTIPHELVRLACLQVLLETERRCCHHHGGIRDIHDVVARCHVHTRIRIAADSTDLLPVDVDVLPLCRSECVLLALGDNNRRHARPLIAFPSLGMGIVFHASGTAAKHHDGGDHKGYPLHISPVEPVAVAGRARCTG